MSLLGNPSRLSFRRQIILTFVVGFFLLTTAFAAFRIITESNNLHRDSVADATSMAQSLAASALPWVLADDVAGLQEAVQAFRTTPEFSYAMVISPQGRVLAHSDASKVGLFLADEQSRALLTAPPNLRILEDSESIIDVAVPIKIDNRQVGWARVASTKEGNAAFLRRLTLHLIAFLLTSTLMSFVAAMLIANRLGRGIESLIRVAEGVQAGDFAARVQMTGGEDEISRLGASLNKMLDTLSQNEHDLQAASHYTRSLIEASLDPLVTISAEGKITDVNRATETATGLGRADLVGTDFSDYFTEPEKAREGYRQVFARGFVTDYPLTLRHGDGHTTDVLYNASLYRDETGNVLGVFAAARDITERNKAEAAMRESETLLQATMKMLPVGLWVIGANGQIVFGNDAAKQIWAGVRYVGVEQLGEYKGWRVDTGELVKPHDWAGIRALEKGETIVGDEIEIECFDGTRKFILDSAVPLRNADGSIRGAITINQDITERKRAEMALQQSEEVLKEAQRIAHLGSWHMDVATNEVFWSEELYKIYGFDPALPPPLYTESMKLFTQESWERLNAAIARAREAGIPYELELEAVNKDGGTGWMWARGEPVHDARGAVVRVRGVVMNITERKKLETQAKQAAAYTRSLIEASLDPLVTISAEGKITDVNRATENATGRSRSELLGTDFADYFTEPDKARAGYQQVFAKGFVTDYPLALRRLDGHTTEVLYNASVYRDETGNVLGVFAAARDITESILAKKELQESEQKFRTLAEAMPQIVWITRPDGWNTYFNQQWVDYTGMTLEESYGHGWNKPFHPDDQQRAWDAWQHATKTDGIYALECRLRRADGAYRWWLIRGVSLHDANGKIVNWFGTCTDIEDIKQAQLEREQYFKFFNTANDLMGIADPNGAFKKINPAFVKTLGYSEEEVLAKPFIDFVHPDDRQATLDEMARQLQRGYSLDFENRYLCKDGSFRWLSWKASVNNEEGLTYAAARDITERKHAEEELAQLSLQNRLILDSAGEGIYGLDIEGRITFINPAASQLLGFGIEELVGQHSHAKFHHTKPDGSRYPEEECPVHAAYKEGAVRRGEDQYWCKDGSRFPVEFISTPIMEAEKITGAVVTFRDIRERKKAEQALYEAQQVFRALIENSPDIIARYDRDCRRTYVNPAYLKTAPIPQQDLLATSPMQVSPLPKDNAEVLQSLLRRVLGTGVAEAVDVLWPKGDGIDYWYNIYAFPEYDREGQVVSVMTVSRDITERKRSEAINASRLHLVQFSMTHSQHELLEETLNEAEKLTGSLIGFYHFVEDDQVSLTLQCWSTRTRTEFCKAEGEGMHYPINDAGVWADCVRQGNALIHNDYASLPHRKGMPAGHATVIRELVVPVFRGNKISAILGIGNKPSDYNEQDIEIVSLLGDLTWEIAERKKAEGRIIELNRDLERRVTERTAQLETANKELEAFSYSVSHDLRTPLRAIDGFSHILLDDYSGTLDDEGRRLLNVVRDNTNKMGRLIDDILAFSRLGRKEMTRLPVDMTALAKQTAAELASSWDGRDVRLEIGDLPPAHGDAAMLRQVWANLLGNAIKFSSTRTTALISVSGRKEGSELIYCVKDNGVGFDMQYVNKLFGVFQRLHGAEEFEGTGAGLAIVKRVISRHGGREWAEGKPNEGAAFYFSLPATKESDVPAKEDNHG